MAAHDPALAMRYRGAISSRSSDERVEKQTCTCSNCASIQPHTVSIVFICIKAQCAFHIQKGPSHFQNIRYKAGKMIAFVISTTFIQPSMFYTTYALNYIKQYVFSTMSP